MTDDLEKEDTTAVEFQFQFTGKDGKPYTIHAEYFSGDEDEKVQPHISIAVVQDENGHAVPDWPDRFDIEKFKDAAATAGETQSRAEGHEDFVGDEDEEEERVKEKEEEEPETDWRGEEDKDDKDDKDEEDEEEEEEGLVFARSEEEEEERLRESIKKNLTSVQRRTLNEDINFSPDDEDVLVKALDIQDNLQGEKRDPSPDEALTLWRANNLRRQVHAVRRRMHQIRHNRGPRPVASLLPAPGAVQEPAHFMAQAEPQGELSGPVPPPMEPSQVMPPPMGLIPPPPKKGPFKAILDDAIAEADGITAAANAGSAAATAATAPATAAAAATQAPVTAAGAQKGALDKIIKDIDAKVKPLVKNLATTAIVAQQLGTKDPEQWVPKAVRDKNPTIPWDRIWKNPRELMR